MIDDLEALLRRLDKAESNYLELLQSYQSLIHEVETLKVQLEDGNKKAYEDGYGEGFYDATHK